MSVQTVVFDLDGTLLDHRGSVTSALDRWLPTLGASASPDVVAAWFAAEHRHFPAWQRGQISFAEQRRRRLRDLLPLIDHPVDTDDELDRVFDGYLQHYEGAWRLFADVAPTLSALAGHGLELAVLSNGTAEQQMAKVARTGLSAHVRSVFTAEGLGVAKPDPAAFTEVCRRLGVSPHSVLHVGDLYDLDVTAPRAAGLRAVHLDRYDEGPHDEGYRITSLLELSGLLRA